jgi:hypothetical protein
MMSASASLSIAVLRSESIIVFDRCTPPDVRRKLEDMASEDKNQPGLLSFVDDSEIRELEAI